MDKLLTEGLIFQNLIRDTVVILATADLHFTAFDPEQQYQLLLDQQLAYARSLPQLDIFSINGDIFDHKVTTTSKGALYAMMYMNEVVRICKEKNATLLLIHGTYSHDASQLNLFMEYVNDPDIDIRIVNNIQFEAIKGLRCLCIPELNGVDDVVYQEALYTEVYDICFMHGTIKGASMMGGSNARLFTIEDFRLCRGLILAGHVHTSGCHYKHFYYSGSPYRWQFGEEEPKGFLMALYDPNSGYNLVEFQEIKCPTYVTIHLDALLEADPYEIVQEITIMKESNRIDFIRVIFDNKILNSSQTILNNYYRNNNNVKLVYAEDKQMIETEAEKNNPISQLHSYLLDKNTTPQEKFVQYVNESEGCAFITLDDLLRILKEE